VLTENCGCHYVDGTNSDVADVYFQEMDDTFPLDIATWADFQGNVGETMLSTIDDVISRVDNETLIAMPPPTSCDVGTGVHITPEDKALLLEWLNAGAPDGASWMGGGDSSGGDSSGGDSTGGTSSG
jgi:hypothetical protein